MTGMGPWFDEAMRRREERLSAKLLDALQRPPTPAPVYQNDARVFSAEALRRATAPGPPEGADTYYEVLGLSNGDIQVVRRTSPATPGYTPAGVEPWWRGRMSEAGVRQLAEVETGLRAVSVTDRVLFGTALATDDDLRRAIDRLDDLREAYAARDKATCESARFWRRTAETLRATLDARPPPYVTFSPSLASLLRNPYL